MVTAPGALSWHMAVPRHAHVGFDWHWAGYMEQAAVEPPLRRRVIVQNCAFT